MTAMSTDRPTVMLQRTIPAPPNRVYRAWLEPELLQRWMSAASKRIARAEVDERPGGRLRIWQIDEDGADAGGFECVLRELVEDEKLVLDWGFVGPERVADPAHDSRLTVTLRPTGEGTELTLVHERLEALRAAMPEVAANVETGWSIALDKLAGAL